MAVLEEYALLSALNTTAELTNHSCGESTRLVVVRFSARPDMGLPRLYEPTARLSGPVLCVTPRRTHAKACYYELKPFLGTQSAGPAACVCLHGASNGT